MEQELEQQVLDLEKYHNTADGRVQVWFGLRTIFNNTDELCIRTKELADKYAAAGMRVEVDRSNNTIGYKIRAAQQEKIPYMLVVGGKEVASGTVSVRSRKGDVTNDVPAEEFMLNALREIASKAR